MTVVADVDPRVLHDLTLALGLARAPAVVVAAAVESIKAGRRVRVERLPPPCDAALVTVRDVPKALRGAFERAGFEVKGGAARWRSLAAG